jgi:Tfp pilus assembly protein PilO
MTFSEEFVTDADQELLEGEAYPTAFGITLTPQVQGIALGVMGLLGAGWIFINFGMPAYQKYSELKTEEQEKQELVQGQKSGTLDRRQQELTTQLQQAKNRNNRILALFANEQTLDTLLLDISRQARQRNLKILSFQPVPFKEGETPVVKDSSLGPALNNKLKRYPIELSVEGGFQETQAFLGDLERLQPLLLLDKVSSELEKDDIVGVISVDAAQKKARVIPQKQQKITTNLTLNVIAPLSSEEAKKLTSEAKAGTEGAGSRERRTGSREQGAGSE